MKKLLLATAIAALSVSAAQAAPTVYGKAFVTADYVNAERDVEGADNDLDSDSVQVNSNVSRLGFKGSEAIFIWVFFYKKAFLLPLCFMFRVSKEWC